MTKPLHLFDGYGVELEYMIVHSGTLDIHPMADRIIHARGDRQKNEIRSGDFFISNELAMHVIEIKTDRPVAELAGLTSGFQAQVRQLNDLLEAAGCRLLPTAMHPWMNPHRETILWPHGDRDIYDAFNRIFDCRGHGWSNLQSTHLNLPFHGDHEFHALHSAIRLILPVLPALSASSPFCDGMLSGKLDTRLEVYRKNCARIPSVTGRVVPERVESQKQYEDVILQPIYNDMADLDPDGILRDEWVNARGAIARFSRGSIEIRVLDIQECPRADLAILQFITALLKILVRQEWSDLAAQEIPDDADLENLFLEVLKQGRAAILPSPGYCSAFGINSRKVKTVGDLLENCLERLAVSELAAVENDWMKTIGYILNNGCLSERMIIAAKGDFGRSNLHKLYENLAGCLAEGRLFSK